MPGMQPAGAYLAEKVETTVYRTCKAYVVSVLSKESWIRRIKRLDGRRLDVAGRRSYDLSETKVTVERFGCGL